MLDFPSAAAMGVVALMFCGCAFWAYVHQGRRHARDLGAARVLRDGALGAERTALRLLRLTTHELRNIGMVLQGHVDALPGLVATSQPHLCATGLAAAAAQVQGLADELQDHASPGQEPRILREELVDVAALLADVVAATVASLGPGRRNWRMADASAPTLLWADRRALRHVLARVLTNAVRNSGHDDWIDIALQADPEGLVLSVQDEGGGFATPGASGLPASPVSAAGPGDADSRGIGLRLTLARSLMQAHGGRLEVEALAQVGCRVSLIFPAARLRHPAGEHPH